MKKIIITENQIKNIISGIINEQNPESEDQKSRFKTSNLSPITQSILSVSTGLGTDEDGLLRAFERIEDIGTYNNINKELFDAYKLSIEKILNQEMEMEDIDWVMKYKKELSRIGVTLTYKTRDFKPASSNKTKTYLAPGTIKLTINELTPTKEESISEIILKNLPCVTNWQNKVEDKKNNRLVLYITDDKKQYINVYSNNRAGIVMPGVSKTVNIRCNQKGQIELLENNKIMYVVDPKNPSKKTKTPNPKVIAWQEKLNKEIDAKLVPDGIWGPKTQEAYLRYKRYTEKTDNTIGNVAKITGPEIPSIKNIKLPSPKI